MDRIMLDPPVDTTLILRLGFKAKRAKRTMQLPVAMGGD